jgi:hypothetical protein
MDDKKITSTLLTEAHSVIAHAAEAAIAKVGVPLGRVPAEVDTSRMNPAHRKMVAAIRAAVSKMTLTYPPEARVLTAGEERALLAMSSMRLSAALFKSLSPRRATRPCFTFYVLWMPLAIPT